MSNEDTPRILYEDADIAAVNKPAGLLVHPDGRSKGPFLTDWIVERFPEAMNVGEPGRAFDGTDLDRSGIVHRLDAETSGVLLVAKTAKGFACLKEQFKTKSIDKRYITFVWGEFVEEFGTINRPIGRSGSDFRKRSAGRGARGIMRSAETYWTRIWTGQSDGERFSLIEAQPKTGRTHQIRVHMNAVNHPVVCDTLYAPKRPAALGFGRMALHSRSIEFENTEGEKVTVVAPVPEDFARAYKELGISLK